MKFLRLTEVVENSPDGLPVFINPVSVSALKVNPIGTEVWLIGDPSCVIVKETQTQVLEMIETGAAKQTAAVIG